MIRRRFLHLATLAGAGGLASLGLEAAERKTVVYQVKGFTCITCAVGLDALLQRQTGVVRSTSSYPEGTVKIEFHPHLVTEDSLKAFIAEMGFKAVSA
jgi:copper chaperone CopZ